MIERRTQVLNAVERAMSSLDYSKLDGLVFRTAAADSKVEHHLVFDLWGERERFLTGQFGMKYAPAEAFAAQCVLLYGGPLYQLMELDDPNHCSMKFPIGSLAKWTPRESLDLSILAPETVSEQVLAAISTIVSPLVRRIRAPKSLLDVLRADSDPCRWPFTNGAIRAAQIVFLAKTVGVDRHTILDELLSFDRIIASQLPRGTNTKSYLERILGDVEVH